MRINRVLVGLMLIAGLLAVMPTAQAGQTTTIRTVTTSFSGSLDACSGTIGCEPDDAGPDDVFHWVVNPDSQITTITMGISAGGTKCAQSGGCGAQFTLCDNDGILPQEGTAGCSGGNRYAEWTYTSSASNFNNVLSVVSSAHFGTVASTPIASAGTFRASHTLVVELNYGTQTVTYTFDGGAPVTTAAGLGTLSRTGFLWVETLGGSGSSGTASDTAVSWSGEMLGVLPVDKPDAPPGISAQVVRQWTGSAAGQSCLIDVRWVLSANDPDRETGEYEYHVLNTALGVTSNTVDTVTSMDGDGVRYRQLDYGGSSSPGPVTIQVYALNTDTNEPSFYSEAVTVDCGVLGDFDSAGSQQTGAVPGASATDTASGLKGFCAGLMGDSDGSLFLCGLILVATVFLSAAGAFAALATGGDKNRPVGHGPMVAGSVGGFGMMVFNVFAGIWGVVWAIVLIVLVAAVLTFLIKRSMGGGAAGGE